MTNIEFIEKLKFAVSKNTIYAKGCFGQPITMNLLSQKQKQYPAWYNSRIDKFNSLVGKHYFGFDCIGLIKGILWGWNATESKELGGCVYQSNDVPDTTELGLINSCTNVSSDMNNIFSGELLYMNGHCGVYIGNNQVIECTPAKAGNVQILPLSYHKWTLHGKLPWIQYEEIKNENVESNQKIYRIRKTWEDASSQIGAYYSLEYAKEACKEGYSVFDEKGNVVYPISIDTENAIKTNVIYTSHRIPTNTWGNEIVGYNLYNTMGYSGSFGKEIDKVAIRLSEGEISYTAHRNGKWGKEIHGYSKTDTNNYAGSSNSPIDAIAIKASNINGTLKYRVHRKTDNKWGNWITGYSTTDTNNYAGSFGKPIDAIQIGIE